MTALRIMLTGASGQIGGELRTRFLAMGDAVELFAPNRTQLDIAHARRLRDAIRDFRPALIINAAAWTAVAAAEEAPAAARAANAEAPAVMAEEARRSGIALIHYSTDYVFDGRASKPYTENSDPHPLNVYGATKRDGELAIEASGAAHWIFRTSWVYSLHGNNFMKTVIRLLQRQDRLSIVDDQIGAPTGAATIADICCGLLDSGGPDRIGATSGLYHLSAAGATSWHGYAVLIATELHRLGVPMKISSPADIVAVPSSAFPPPPARPLNSRLCCDKLSDTLQVTLAPWEKDVLCCLNDMVRRHDLAGGGHLPE
ncbi:dTDP-4-dehydrorhamnose reductase [Herbaspirillum sp. WKF16]|uniref:dTDP-4-dehydrorhamnose reductase n=1 Tax=Herbaspirillum sp. WKF16 TaxID=3028312 RepID=UPI0023A983EC|nr:dTDP-4-dehydrorhamnose reductase [Herbaspirillum sp. WKF16]WDZ95740.1 dTDP-4-dehydrorhamnose reductase [Herbaspirillum sp. WKF16]